MLRASVFIGFVFLLNCAIEEVRAQQLVQYDTVANPYLLLLREPDVIDDLDLSREQLRLLVAMTDKHDPALLSLRNKPAQQANEIFLRLVSETKSGLDDILDSKQRERYGQIVMHIRGIRSILDEQVVGRLKLTDGKVEQIREILEETGQSIGELRKQAQDGKPREPLEKESKRLREQEQKKILALLTTSQRNALFALFGPRFDPAKLGKLKFKAPELSDGDGWVNSKPLRIASLKGEVIALHFWAFG